MNTAPAQLETAPRRRWLLWVAAVFAVQTGIIFWLGAKHPVSPRPPNFPPPVSLAVNYNSELAALHDPALFALPNRHGFSGSAWALTPRTQYAAADWDEPWRWLPLPAEKLGVSFRQLVVDARTAPLAIAEKPEPSVAAPGLAADLPSPPTASTLRIEGELAGRALVSPLELPALRNADVLAASEVRVLVDAGGKVVSAVLLAASGSGEADAKALALARSARFEPVAGGGRERLAHPLAGLAGGQMIFQWLTLAPAVEIPPANP